MVEDLIGPLVDVSDATSPENVEAVTEWASDIAREVINILPTEMLWSVGEEIPDSGGGASGDITPTFVEDATDSLTDKISALTITTAGSGYASDPLLTIESPTGDHAVLRAFTDGSAIIAVNIVSEGSGYAGTETITVTGQNGA